VRLAPGVQELNGERAVGRDRVVQVGFDRRTPIPFPPFARYSTFGKCSSPPRAVLRIRVLVYLLALLLLSAPIEDLWVSAALRTPVNTILDEDSDYLPAPCPEDGRRAQERQGVLLAPLARCSRGIPVGLRITGTPPTACPECPGSCLYVFMALLR
jgi:hypothetical protein